MPAPAAGYPVGMALLSRRARVALKAARTGITTYGRAKKVQGRASARGDAGPTKRSVAAGFGIGAALAYVLDPAEGKRRRDILRGRSLQPFKRARRRATLDDVTLARKVETEIFRDPDAPKGRVSVNTEHGVVFLRGELEPEQIRHLVAATERVHGVERVENLLHPPGAPAPRAS